MSKNDRVTTTRAAVPDAAASRGGGRSPAWREWGPTRASPWLVDLVADGGGLGATMSRWLPACSPRCPVDDGGNPLTGGQVEGVRPQGAHARVRGDPGEP